MAKKWIMDILRILDKEGVESRKKHRFRRRKYTNPGPNFTWHLDGYDKLKKFGFDIHGCVDGFSRKVIWLSLLTSNKNPKQVADLYVRALEKHQCKFIIKSPG
eukprot:m.184740 g.184740  ORF g.184740 m.184740 type:complete len:103 (+) comp39333_c0_seq1:422-730(+)